MRKILLLVAFCTLALVGSPANADSIYTLDYDSCTGGCGNNGQGSANNSFGTVTLHQVNGDEVQVTMQLTDPSYIVNTGSGSNHAPFAFNTDTGVTIGNISDQFNATSTLFTATAGSAISGLSTFTNEIACTNACPNGASHGGGGDYLSFVVTGNSGALSINDFIASGGFYFAADIIGPSGNTGEVASNQAPTITTDGSGGGTPAPEPASLALLGGGLMALAGVRRRRITSRR